MLQPDQTVLLTEALRPPHGYRVDTAVATTYSMNLTAILLAPMTFAMHDIDDASDLVEQDPIKVLDAAQKYLSRTTVFCQSAAIHIPRNYSQIYEFLEDSIQQVTPPREHSLFHPKIWAVRYKNEDGGFLHRFIVASKNLTLDSSRDTLLALEEHPEGTIEARSAADFVSGLPGLAVTPLPAERRRAVEDLVRTLQEVRFEAPAPFTGGRLVPLGMTDTLDWAFPANPLRVLAISPFLAAETLDRIASRATERTLVSRPEELDRLGARRLGQWAINTLSTSLDLDDVPAVEAIDEDTPVSAAPNDHGVTTTFNGLHAKTVVADMPGDVSMTVTGSANLTRQGWATNVEFDAVLTGPTAACGVASVLEDQGTVLGLRSVLQPYTPSTEGKADPSIETSAELESFHQALALSRPQLDVLGGDDKVYARLRLDVPEDAPGRTEVWLITTPQQKRELGQPLEWEVAPESITPFIAIRTTAGTGKAKVTRSCCLLVSLVGDVPDRRQATIASILTGPDRMLRYLSFLLGINAAISTRIETTDLEVSSSIRQGVEQDGPPTSPPPVVLYEPLVRAVSHSPDHLASIADQIAELRKHPGVNDLIPEEFSRMWDVVLAFTHEKRNR